MQQHGSKYFVSRPPPPSDPGVRSIGQASSFSEHGKLHIKLKEITNAATWQIFCLQIPDKHPYPNSPPWVRSKGQNSFFSEHGHIAYQIKENHKCSNMEANICPQISLILSIGLKFNFLELSHVAYQIKGNHKYRNMVATVMPTYLLPQPL